MSRWRQKGFVQDSDEDEEESQLDSQGSRQKAGTIGRVERDEQDAGPQESREELREELQEDSKNGACDLDDVQIERELKQLGLPTITPTKRVSPSRPTLSPITPGLNVDVFRAPTESPDPLQSSPSPARRQRPQTSVSLHASSAASQRNTRPFSTQDAHNATISSQISNIPHLAAHMAEPNVEEKAAAPSGLLERFGVAPMSDDSDDEALSDPPSDMEFSPPAFAEPHRRTTAQIVIPSSTALQRHIEEQWSRREFRQRKPIQLHPYALEGELYRREVQSRGLKPVARERSPQRDQRRQGAETQEKEFDPEASLSSSPAEPEIPVSTPVHSRVKAVSRGSSTRRPAFVPAERMVSTQLHYPRAAKRRKLNLSLTQAAAAPSTSSEDRSLPRDIWSIPPNSPPLSSSPPLYGKGSARRIDRHAVDTPAPNLPTPATSSVFQDDPPALPESDQEPLPRSGRKSGSLLRRSIRTVHSDNSASESETSSDDGQVDNELRKVGRKIKGVLPASWLRIDKQAQERRQARLRGLEQEQNRVATGKSPELTEPQRGVAKRIIKRGGQLYRAPESETPSKEVVLISDGSDSDTTATASHHVRNTQHTVEDASALAAVFDRRYALTDDLSDMEDDRLHLPMLSGTGPKRKRQTKLTDTFGNKKKVKSTNGVVRVGNGEQSRAGEFGIRRHTKSRKMRRTPPPALSIIDFDASPSMRGADMPPFLRIARRQALRRPDLARQSPSSKQIRLHNIRDTEDANFTLRQWRQGTLKPKANAGPRRPNTGRSPLVDTTDNGQRMQREPQFDADTVKDHSVKSPSEKGVVHRQRRQILPPSLQIFCRPTSRKGSSSQTAIARKGQLHLRTAQLEGEETTFSRGHRKIAFERGLRHVEHQFGASLPQDRPHLNPQIARFLADDDTVLPPLPSAKDIGEPEVKSQARQAQPIRKRLTRKRPAHRVDIDAREYRQPSEPAVHEVLNAIVTEQSREANSEGEPLVLQGLGPYGTRYPITFDVHSLSSETYFHSSTFIGSDELRRALKIGLEGSRDLDESAGYNTVAVNTISLRCGPWNDETCSSLQNVARELTTSSQEQTCSSEMSPTTGEEVMLRASHFLRTLIAYISDHLSFLDPIDRRDFVAKSMQISQSLFEGIFAACSFAREKQIGSSMARIGVRAMSYLLVLSIQILRIAQHPTVEPSCPVNMRNLVKIISQTIVSHLVQQGIPELSQFLELQKRQRVREAGVQENDVLVESTVICMHSMASTNLPTSGFWDYLSQELSPTVIKTTQLSVIETIWATIFTFLPFAEIDISGLPTRERRETFQKDNWTGIRDLVRRLFDLYPSTFRKHSTSLNAYVRANLGRCHRLMKHWHWRRPEILLNAIFDFFGKNGLKQLRCEASSGSVSFLETIASEQPLDIDPEENSFHIALKCLVLGLEGMKDYPEKKVRSFVFRTIPNHGRAYPKDQPLDEESLVALRNHHDLLSTLYRAAPPACRPKLNHIQDLVDHGSSHREACRLSVRAWANLAMFQLHTKESYESAKSFALWHKDIMHQTLRQYRLAKVEAEDYLKSGVLDGTSDVSVVMVRQTMERNQEQVIATLRDCIAGMKRTIQHGSDPASVKAFLIDSDIVHLLELPHLEDRRLVSVIRDTLEVLEEYVLLQKAPLCKEDSQQPSDESQDYGDFPDMDDLNVIDSNSPGDTVEPSSLNFIEIPLWRLLSNAFGAESAPDDNLLMSCVETWVRVARSQVASGERSWSYYLESFSQVSWKQLRHTEQTRKFAPYFLAALIDSDQGAYDEHRDEFIQALLLSLVERESMLRFQHRLLHAIVRSDPSHPLLQNLPFFRKQHGEELDITAETVRTRRLALISSLLSNIRDEVQGIALEGPARAAEARRRSAAMLKDFMTAMKYNYELLRQGSTVLGAYVEFVQKIVQFLKQYTNDICPVLPFFTDSVNFPLPAEDPTYVVGRLCGYAPKAADAGTMKQLSVFIQTVAQQAAADNHQLYLVNQLITALCTNDAPATDRAALRSVLLQGIFPVYIEGAFFSSTAFIVARPILQALSSILDTVIFDVRIVHPERLSPIIGSIIAISHAFIRGTEQLKDNPALFQEPYVLCALTHMLEAMISILPILDYICRRTHASKYAKPALVVYMEQLSVYVAEMLYNLLPHSISSYQGDANAHAPEPQHMELLAFCKRGLDEAFKANWTATPGAVWFGHGHNRREVVIDIGNLEEEKARLVAGIEAFHGALYNVYGVGRYSADEAGYPRDDIAF